MNASLNEKLAGVEWGEYRLGDLFYVGSSKQIFHANDIECIYSNQVENSYPYVVRMTTNNGIRGYICENEKLLNAGNTLSFAQDTFSVFYQKQKYFTGNKVKILYPNFNSISENIMKFITAVFQKALENLSWGTGSTVKSIEDTLFNLPIKNGVPDFDFMESFVAELEAERVAELEAERVAELEAYLLVSGLKDTLLTDDELKALERFEKVEWGEFNLEELFGKSTRGKRLKSEDRIRGNLPFVTAGETDEGISAFISNNVEVFSKNTTTIDMFGSAKYRNYDYGADDHIAVVHTEKLLKYAAIFVTTACHKSAHNGDFSYSRNFYAKDADNLFISLPTKDSQPDFEYMDTLISAIQKLVIADVVKFSDEKIKAAKEIIE